MRLVPIAPSRFNTALNEQFQVGPLFKTAPLVRRVEFVPVVLEQMEVPRGSVAWVQAPKVRKEPLPHELNFQELEKERAQSSDANILLFRLKNGEMHIDILTTFMMLEDQHFCTSFLISST